MGSLTQNSVLPYVSVVTFGNQLTAACLAAAANSTLLIPPGSIVPVTNNTVIPTNVSLVVEKGGSFVITKNKTLTINGPIQAGRYSIFTFDPTYTFTSPNFLVPVSFTNGCDVFPEWFGATGNDAAHDDRFGIQAAQDSFAATGTLDFAESTYYILSIGRTNWLGHTCGIYANNDTTVNGRSTAVITWKCKGIYNTIFTAKNSLGLNNLICFHFQGAGGNVLGGLLATINVDIGIQATVCCAFEDCNGLIYEPIATGGGSIGTLLHACTPFLSAGASYDEFSTTGLVIAQSSGISVFAPQTFEGTGVAPTMTVTNTVGNTTINGRTFAGMGAYALNTTPGPITILTQNLSNMLNTGTALSINMEVACNVGLILAEPQIGTNGLDPTQQGGYNLYVTEAYTLTLNGGSLWRAQLGSTILKASKVTFNGTKFDGIGVFNQSAPYQVIAADIDVNVYSVEFNGCDFRNIAGSAIRSKAQITKINGGEFNDCCNGGLTALLARAGACNATTGNKVINIIPQNTSTIVEITGTSHYAPSGENAGKYGIYIDCSTAVPTAGNVKINGNASIASSYATPYAYGTATALQANTWNISNDQLASATPQNFPTIADANAPNSTCYFSSTASKLVWKDAGGTVNNLY